MYRSPVVPQAVAHRGLHINEPENSIGSFRRAVEAGAEAIELDVHATRDGHVVVHHDFTVRSPAASKEHSLLQISDLNADDLRAHLLSDGSLIPTLTEALTEIPPAVVVYIEVKPAGIERLVVDCILEWPFNLDRCAIHSFDHRIPTNARVLSQKLPVGILQVGYPLDAAGMLRAVGARDFWQQWEFTDEEIVDRVHEYGGRVVAWNCNTQTGWDRLSAIGVDAICTDAVDDFVAWREARLDSSR